MLRRLQIRNLAVVAAADIEFGPGLNVLTGETGAGKSIVVDSLALLAGARASDELIRTGAQTLTLTAVFDPADEAWRQTLAESGLDAQGDELIVRREVQLEGRNRVFLNDQPSTLRLLAAVASPLLQIHSQREEVALLAADQQRRWLDRVGGEKGERQLARTAESYHRWRELADRLDRVTGHDRLRQERIDLLRFQVGEIDAAGIRVSEEEELRQERDTLRHLETVIGGMGGAVEALYEGEGSVNDLLGVAERRLEEVAEWRRDAAEAVETLRRIRIEVEEIARSIGGRLEDLQADPGRLDEVESRLALIDRLARKYGGSGEEVLRYRERSAEELERLEADAADREGLESRVAEALEEYRKHAEGLSAARREWAGTLCSRVHDELKDLALGRARFSVELEPRRSEEGPLLVEGAPVGVTESGIDRVSFAFAPNPGEEARPLARIVSGGELARVYLALQLAVRARGAASRSTLVFDEVDAGVGGAEAAALGEKLQRLATGGQILAVTHLPQVASFADRHFLVEKEVSAGRTTVSVGPLESGERVEEVARMLAGSRVTELSRSHARELIAGSMREVG